MESGVLVVLFAGWVILAAAVATIGSDRKIGYAATFWLSFLLTPIIAALIALGSERKKPEQPTDKQADQLFAESVKLEKANRRAEAIAKLKECLALQPTSSFAHYNLACNYSRLGRSDDAFRALTSAVKLGYNNFTKIQSDPDLQFLRAQAEFAEYAASGYREFAVSQASEDFVSRLERLAALKEKGILTEAEFSEQKAKILKGS